MLFFDHIIGFIKGSCLLVLVLCLTGFNVMAQTNTSIKVTDDNGVPLTGVTIGYNDNFTMTDTAGMAFIKISEQVKISCRYIGYQAKHVLVSPGENKVIAMSHETTNLQQVVITGQLNDTKLERSVEKIKVIDAATIKQLQANNLQELLVTQTNVRITEDNILGSSLTLNGLGGENVKIMIDGVPVIGRQNGNIDLSQIMLNNIERVEIIEGSMSVLYSTNASGGVINLITKKKSVDKANVTFNSKYESPGSWYLDGLYTQQLGASNLTLSGGRSYFDGYPKMDTSRLQAWKPYIKYFGGAAFSFIKGRYSADIKANAFHQTTLSRGVPVTSPYEAYALDQRYITKRYDAALFQQWEFNNKSRINISLAYNYYSRDLNSYHKDLTTLDNNEVSGESDTTTFHSGLVRAVYVNPREGKSFGYQVGIEGNYETASGNLLKYKTQHILELGALFTGEWSVRKNIQLKPGIRVNYISGFDNPVIPSLNGKWDINKFATLRAGVARGYRAPSLKELNLDFVDVNHNIHGNAALKPEKSISANTSLDYRYKLYGLNISLQPSIFYNYISNQIILAITDTAAAYYSYSNLQKTNNYGGSVAVAISGKYVSFNTSYGLTGISSQESSFAPNTIWSPEFNISATVTMPSTHTGISAVYKNVGVTPIYVTNDNGETIKYQTEGYTLMDVIVSQPLFNNFINFSAGIKNIFDVTNIASTLQTGAVHSSGGITSIARGRYFTASIQVNLNVKKKEDKK